MRIRIDVHQKQYPHKKPPSGTDQEMPNLTDDGQIRTDDEFAKSLGDYSTLEDVRAAIREDLEKNADQQGDSALRKNVLETLADEIQVELPKGLVELEAKALLQQVQVQQ